MLCHRCGKVLFEGAPACPACGPDLVGGTGGEGRGVAGNETGSASTVGYAGFWRRAVALLIDKFLLWSVNLCLTLVFLIASGRNRGDHGLLTLTLASALCGFLLQWLYFTLMESSGMRATLGKAAVGIMVTDSRGAGISWPRANARYWAKLVSALPFGFGFLMAGFTAKKQALHDFIAGTLVVRVVRK
jgi:uncharacterized RDD family membrane protein YckC